MYNKNKDNVQILKLLYGCEQFSKEYKLLLNSKEYQIGNKINQYKSLLKKHQYITLLKRLLLKNNKYNSFIESETNEIINEKKYFSEKKIAVYTAIFGNYDKILEPIIKPDNIDYFIITDQKISNESVWKKVENISFPPNIKNNIEKNRYCKMFPNEIFKEYEYSIYVDGNVLITSDLTPLVENINDFPISMHKHKNRKCVYDEIDACIKKGKTNKKDLIRHKKYLIENGVPSNNGLLEATIIARKHNDMLCKKIMNEWWNEFCEYSKRDQISLIDVLWKNNIKIEKIANMGNNIFENNLFVIVPHK